MAIITASVRYKYRKAGGAGSWTTTSWAGPMKSQSETLVMQKLREKYKDYDVELVELKWK